MQKFDKRKLKWEEYFKSKDINVKYPTKKKTKYLILDNINTNNYEPSLRFILSYNQSQKEYDMLFMGKSFKTMDNAKRYAVKIYKSYYFNEVRDGKDT